MKRAPNTSESTKDIQSRITGSFLGFAAGDRNGGPIQFGIRLAASLLDLGRFNKIDILNRYVDWWKDDAFDTGAISAIVLAKIEEGVPGQSAVQQAHAETGGMTAGCNPAHRSIPLAIASFLPGNALREAGLEEASLTHFDPLAGHVSAANLSIIRNLIRGYSWQQSLEDVRNETRIATVQNALFPADPTELSKEGYGPEVLRAAVSFVEIASTFEEALQRSLEFAGPANYCPVLVGGIAGARWGSESIRPEHLSHCTDRLIREITKMSIAFAAQWSDCLRRKDD